ncbi:NADH-quinone oxidoreductase subunit NuoF family protein [Nocardiopsis sp. FIRDI 009]|uniref:NADH-quinone oxidoreductase subunit NuoF family protein n=1 Tax=Nocardiopsis sp. FIRDI 009 TaxID=714197 RepID=UPI000E238B25|nr:NADH-quinone oxidoreductase subunit NuoF family protein [Nocardiopsis sp. FIRDI 009]
MITLTIGRPRLTAGLDEHERVDHDTHLRLHGALPGMTADDLLALAELGSLRGRGGAGFPFARKLRAVLRSARRRGVPARVVVNATEGEPGSAKDRMLLERLPHLVLDGAEMAARALGAPEVVVGIADRAEPGTDGDPVRESLRAAVAERRSSVGLRLVRMPHRFVSGQAGALVQGINGGPPIPPGRPRRASESGVAGLPTLLSNAETYAHAALLALGGAYQYASVGTADQPGTILLTVGGSVVVEAPAGTPLVQVLHMCDVSPGQAVLVGGYHGAWLSPEVVDRVRLSHTEVAEAGGTLGAGVVLPLPATTCPLGEVARVLRYLAGEAAGQCGPCLRGLPALAESFSALAAGAGGPEAVLGAAAVGEGRGACAHPDGSAVFARSALAVFGEDVSEHTRGSGCGRPVAGRLPLADGPTARRTRLSVDWSRCDGHGLCAELLPGLIRPDRDGYPEDQDVTVPDALVGDAELAVRMCPALALRLRPGT